MKCTEIRKLFSPYLDGRVSGAEMRTVARHVEQCSACEREYAAMQRTQQLLSELGTKKAPADLALKLRLAISREAAQSRRPRFEGGFFALPAELRASSGDVPLMLYTGPQLDQSAFGTSLGNMGDDAVVVEAYVDANGRVEDYRILSQPDEAKAVLPQLKNLLIFTTFHPALSMGRPTAGTAVLSFSKISVRG